MSDTTTRTEDKPAAPEAALVPAVDVFEDSAGITLFADLPGVPKEKLAIDVDGDTLTIAGELGLSVPEGMDATHAEVGVPRYRRAFTLSKELDASKVKAECQQGVLKLRIPKLEHVQPKKVVVQVV